MPELPSPLIDVLSAESFAAEHLPGSVNICVYETAFIDKIRIAFPDPTILVTVYGLNSSTLEASVAVKKLEAAGYRRVQVLPGGLEGWKASGGAIEQGTKAVRESVTAPHTNGRTAGVAAWRGG